MKLPLPLLLVCAGSIGVGAIAGISRATGSTPATPTPITQPQSFSAPAPAPVPSAQTASAPNLPAVTISACNGNLADANVRLSPGGQVVGYVPAGSAVYLTGQVAGSWHEVKAPGLIPDPGQVAPENTWIANCFVR